MDAVVEKRRRSQRYERKPTGRRHTISPIEEVWLQAFNQHGPMPSWGPFELTRDRQPSFDYVKHLLHNMWREDVQPGGGGYLDRPGQRIRVIGRNKHEVYANTSFADDYLLGNGLATRVSVPINKLNYHHECLNANIGLSIELGCKRDPHLDFISEHELLPRAPSGSREIPCHIEHEYNIWDKKYNGWRTELREGDTALIPDAYFCIKQERAQRSRYCAFFVEADCGTEMLTRADLNDKSWLATLLKYLYLIDTGEYKRHFGLTCGALVLIVTTSQTQMKGIQRILMQITGNKGSSYILFQTWPDFAQDFYVPKDPRYDFVKEPWQRVGNDPKTGQPYTPLYLVMPDEVIR
jgi:hypothetical protein